MIEKSEECPRCGEVKRWLYDAQICGECGYPNREPQIVPDNPHAVPREELLEKALACLHSAVDQAMGDSDLPNDDSELMAAMQAANHALRAPR